MNAQTLPELRFDHLGVVVPKLSVGRDFLSGTLGIASWTAPIEDPGIGVSVQFGSAGDGVVYELIAPLGDRSPVASVIRTGKHVLNHLAYRTADIAASGEALRLQGCVPTAEPQPAQAYGERLVQFFITPLRFMIELIEAPDHQHAFVPDVISMADADRAAAPAKGLA